ncbi:hypothetical protein L6J37_16610 [Photobacterium sp. WH77]|uniref:hypothetical protein n=1 Tax=unclassified Photobacterium TaxID=2628852 RepID=UPI001EDAF703|nr:MULTISPECIES: hypothetical protein [unclassified Photobacterium]MCG2838455.1 hypothetical protein [Photobacterium sp. WH77]MCG2846072.1 hypothetical protein [Photobacterium sp. WH80]MDO6582128.1 hypothetical protein [Photobacterium sp. 2_MG-2023]
MKWNSVMLSALVVSGVFVANVQSESLLMSYDEYMERCTETYGSDRTTISVCENQYLTMYAKDEEVTAQAETQVPGTAPSSDSSEPQSSVPETDTE